MADAPRLRRRRPRRVKVQPAPPPAKDEEADIALQEKKRKQQEARRARRSSRSSSASSKQAQQEAEAKRQQQLAAQQAAAVAAQKAAQTSTSRQSRSSWTSRSRSISRSRRSSNRRRSRKRSSEVEQQKEAEGSRQGRRAGQGQGGRRSAARRRPRPTPPRKPSSMRSAARASRRCRGRRAAEELERRGACEERHGQRRGRQCDVAGICGEGAARACVRTSCGAARRPGSRRWSRYAARRRARCYRDDRASQRQRAVGRGSVARGAALRPDAGRHQRPGARVLYDHAAPGRRLTPGPMRTRRARRERIVHPPVCSAVSTSLKIAFGEPIQHEFDDKAWPEDTDRVVPDRRRRRCACAAERPRDRASVPPSFRSPPPISRTRRIRRSRSARSCAQDLAAQRQIHEHRRGQHAGLGNAIPSISAAGRPRARTRSCRAA